MEQKAMLEAVDVSVRLGKTDAVHGVSFVLKEGQWLMLTGPNGAGKSTLINAVCQSVPYSGRILLNGQDMRSLRPSRRARKIGVLSQRQTVSYDYSVEEVVALGRYAHRKGLLSGASSADETQIAHALDMTGMAQKRSARMNELSGGEVQRVFLAQVFAQEPDILILDEPANHLDLQYQKQIFSLIADWLSQPGRAVLSVVHDLSLAGRYGTHALLMQEGRCVSQGTAKQVLSRENLQRVYCMDVYAWMRDMLGQWTE